MDASWVVLEVEPYREDRGFSLGARLALCGRPKPKLIVDAADVVAPPFHVLADAVDPPLPVPDDVVDPPLPFPGEVGAPPPF